MKLNKTVIGIIIIVIIIIVVALALTRSRVKGGTIGYRFFRSMDSPGGDVSYIPEMAGNVKGLKEACNEHPDCVAFTSDGHLKKAIVNPDKFIERSGYPDWYGIYIHPKTLR